MFVCDSTSCSTAIKGRVILDLIDLISEMIAGEKIKLLCVKKEYK